MSRGVDVARTLRRNATDAERLLWQWLRAGQAGVRFRRQHPVAGYVLDFYCAQGKVAVEADGGQHFHGAGEVADRERDAALAAVGIRVLRFSNGQILEETDAVL